MVVDVRPNDSGMTAGTPRLLFEAQYEYGANRNQRNYDLASDGRFIMVKTPDDVAPRQIVVVLNWFEELKTRVPVP